MSEITRTVALPGGAESLQLLKFGLTAEHAGAEPIAATFGQRTVTIGSSPENDFVLEDVTASRRHCRIEVDGTGYRLIDDSSKNGTYVADMRVRDVYITEGARIRIGGTTITFSLTKDTTEVRFSGRTQFGGMLGRSRRMREIFGLLERIAPTDATVLVEGRSGTGKELVADAVHKFSARKDGPFIVFDCSAVSHDLIESELFGHVKGAFTGAQTDRAGAFEQANGGTLFIDELGELSPDLQPKLLRALEQRQVRRVGSNQTIDVDVRVVAATNRNLRDEVREGGFREDLYYRFAVITIALPPLKDRPEDVPLLVEHFLEDAKTRLGNPNLNISFSTMDKLKMYDWPGNVRELKNFIDRAVLLASGDQLETKFLRPADPGRADAGGPADGASLMDVAGVDVSMPFKEAKSMLIEAFEIAYWTSLLKRTDGNVSKAGRVAGVHRKSVEYILKKLDLTRSDVDLA